MVYGSILPLVVALVLDGVDPFHMSHDRVNVPLVSILEMFGDASL